MPATYLGRFAPSPTGPLHAGSLVAALGSWLAARAAGGRWIVRMEDLDRPRCVPGMDAVILDQLAAHGLEWDGAVLYQSTRDAAYAAALERLKHAGLAYACACTRRELAAAPKNADGETIYPGTCRAGLAPGRAARAWRVRVDAASVAFDDVMCGPQRQELAREVGDFVVKRADGLYAYQLAVVVDDAFQGVTHVVRGADLLGNTPRQIHLQTLLDLPTPVYAHLPLVTNAAGQKLSKQTRAPALPETHPERALAEAMRVLGLAPPDAGPRELLDWGVANWACARPSRRPA